MEAVMVTGGNGFIGRHLVQALLERGYYVYNAVRHSAGILQDTENYTEILYDSYEMLCEKTEDISHSITCLYHLAWGGSSGTGRNDAALQLDNIHLVCDMVSFCRKKQIKRILYAGSIAEYECLKNITAGNALYKGGGIYSAAKLAGHYMGEISAKSLEIQYIPIIISNIYGVGENSPRFINSIVRKMNTEDCIDFTAGKQLQDFIYISDAIEMIIRIGEKGKAYKQYYIGNETQYPLKQFIKKMAKVLGYAGKLNFGAIPYHDIPLQFDEFNVHSFYEDFSYRPAVSFEKGIALLNSEICDENVSGNR